MDVCRCRLNQTKEYGNGKTAGGIAMSRGAPASTKIYGPGNSQPHKVMDCKKGHLVDVHAVKSYSTADCQSSSTQTETKTETKTETPKCSYDHSMPASSPKLPAVLVRPLDGCQQR